MLLFGGCAWEIFGSAGFTICPGSPTRVRLPPFSFGDDKKVLNQMEFEMNRYMALTSNADDQPLFVDTTAPLHVLLDTAGYRIRAITQLLENLAMRGDIPSDSVILQDFAQLCCIPLRDGCDVLDVVARRLDAEPA